MKELIILIIALIVSAISASIKNKKARTAADTPKKPQYETDVWGDIVGKMDDNELIYETSIEDAEIIEAERIRHKRLAEVKQRYNNKAVQSKTNAIEDEKELPINDDEDCHARHFNIRDAVIYSEILKPKF